MSIRTHQVSIRNRPIVYIVLIKRRNRLDDGLFFCNAMNNAFLEVFME